MPDIAVEKIFVTIFLILNTTQLGSVRMSVSPSVIPSISNMYELLLISIKVPRIQEILFFFLFVYCLRIVTWSIRV